MAPEPQPSDREGKGTGPSPLVHSRSRYQTQGAAVPDEPTDTVPDRFVIRSRNLNRLNPEISVTGDVRFQGNSPGPQDDNVDIREFAFSFQAPLDPYTNTKIFASFGEHHAEIEEAYVYWTGLPGGLRLDLGRFRQQAGELNR